MNSDDEIRRLIARLDSLTDGRSAARDLVRVGERAIPQLRCFLLEGERGTVFEPRQWAVEALGALGAKDVLLEYLRMQRPSNPAVAYAEEAVAITAARQLRRWRTEDVFASLLEVVSTGLQPGAIEALGDYERAEALPFLIRALEDGICRTAAEDALRKYGQSAVDALIDAATLRIPSADLETSASVQRRESALKLLGLTWVSSERWASIVPLLRDPHPQIAVGAAWMALDIGTTDDLKAALLNLLEVVDRAHWLIGEDIKECLSQLETALTRAEGR